MVIKAIKKEFSICKIENCNEVNFNDDYCFLGKTNEELSLVCATNFVPSNVTDREDNWNAFRIQGVLDFSLIGILSKISTLLAEHEIGIFVISTFNTDYILTKSKNFQKALLVLEDAGYEISTDSQ